jgi:hypothetical protein
MPLMPAPPMPTKWICLTACFMRRQPCRALDLVRHPRRRMRPGQRTRLRRHRLQRVAGQAGDEVGELPRRELGLRQVDGRALPAIHSALSRWCEVVLTISGTSTAATPAAHSSLTVIAPARQTIRSHFASRSGMSSMKGSTSAGVPLVA